MCPEPHLGHRWFDPRMFGGLWTRDAAGAKTGNLGVLDSSDGTAFIKRIYGYTAAGQRDVQHDFGERDKIVILFVAQYLPTLVLRQLFFARVLGADSSGPQLAVKGSGSPLNPTFFLGICRRLNASLHTRYS